ncbi:hypothetical protein [Hoylesella nanceiensis]|uniref:hypothetical protein n=1 Tax=Hoylesella nanceiensis TaxID=425941 RepID=UPI0028D3935F|nr:hypothetical protein [Hoylesella nanceiensis]
MAKNIRYPFFEITDILYSALNSDKFYFGSTHIAVFEMMSNVVNIFILYLSC